MLDVLLPFADLSLVAMAVAVPLVRLPAASHMSAACSEAEQDLERLVAERTQEIAQDSADLLRAEKLSFAGQLAAGVAHEINNPLAPLRANIESVRACAQAIQHLSQHADEETRGLIEDLLPAVDEMRACVQRIASLVTNFRRLTQIDVDELPSKQVLAIALAEVFDGEVLPLVESRVAPDACVVAGPGALRAILRESGAFLVDVARDAQICASGKAEGETGSSSICSPTRPERCPMPSCAQR